jgi:hypothetical protein
MVCPFSLQVYKYNKEVKKGARGKLVLSFATVACLLRPIYMGFATAAFACLLSYDLRDGRDG